MPQPIVLTCGEPAGIGPELALQALGAGVPVVWMGDPAHLPTGTPWQPVERPSDPVGVGVLCGCPCSHSPRVVSGGLL